MSLEINVQITLREPEIRELCENIHSDDADASRELFKELQTDPEKFRQFTRFIQSNSVALRDHLISTMHPGSECVEELAEEWRDLQDADD